MAKVLQHRRGTATEHSDFVGAEGEFTYDTTEKRIVAHDGATAGGIPMAKKSEVDAIDVGVTSINGNAGDVTAAQTGCLPLSGGTMTGVLDMQSNTLRSGSSSLGLNLRGGTSTSDGAYLGLYGKDSSETGMFTLASSDGTTIVRLQGASSGALTWGGKNIVRSVNGTSADANGDVIDDQFKAKATNPITSTTNDTPTNWINLGGGAYWYSTNGCLNDQPSQWGFLINYVASGDVFQIWKKQSSGAMYCRSGNANGWAQTWKAFVTSVNGVNAGGDGNVTISTGGGSSAYQIPYATCSTASTTGAKVATISNGVSLSLVAGAVVVIKFSKALFGDQYNSSFKFTTLNVNSTGAKTVKTFNYNGLGGVSPANQVYVFVYDGTYWNMVTIGRNWDTYDSGAD